MELDTRAGRSNKKVNLQNKAKFLLASALWPADTPRVRVTGVPGAESPSMFTRDVQSVVGAGNVAVPQPQSSAHKPEMGFQSPRRHSIDSYSIHDGVPRLQGSLFSPTVRAMMDLDQDAATVFPDPLTGPVPPPSAPLIPRRSVPPTIHLAGLTKYPSGTDLTSVLHAKPAPQRDSLLCAIISCFSANPCSYSFKRNKRASEIFASGSARPNKLISAAQGARSAPNEPIVSVHDCILRKATRAQITRFPTVKSAATQGYAQLVRSTGSGCPHSKPGTQGGLLTRAELWTRCDAANQVRLCTIAWAYRE